MADARHAAASAHGTAAGGAAHDGRGGGSGSRAGHPAPARTLVPQRALWFGLFGAPAAWSLQTLVNYPVAAHACFPGLYPLAEPTVGALRGIVFAVSMAAVSVCIAALVVAWRAWRRTRGEEQESSGEGNRHSDTSSALETGVGRTRFMAMGGVLMSAAFLIASVAHMAVIFLVSPCGSG